MSVYINGTQLSNEKQFDSLVVKRNSIVLDGRHIILPNNLPSITIVIQNCQVNTLSIPEGTVMIKDTSKIETLSLGSGDITVDGDINTANVANGNITCTGKINDSTTNAGVIAASSTIPSSNSTTAVPERQNMYDVLRMYSSNITFD